MGCNLMDRASKQHVEYHLSEWKEHFSKSGKKYYYNSRTAESVWEIPASYLQRKHRSDAAENNNHHHHHSTSDKRSRTDAGLLSTPKTNGHPAPITSHRTSSSSSSSAVATPRGATPTAHTPTTTGSGTPRVSSSTSTPRATPTSLDLTPKIPRPSVSRRVSLNHRSGEEVSNPHEHIPSPVIQKDSKTPSSAGNHHKPKTPLSATTPSSTGGSSKLTRFLASSLDVEDPAVAEDVARKQFLDPACISVLTNQPAELLERQSNQCHAEARRILDVDLLRTIADCANLRAVQNVQCLRAHNIENRLEMLRAHIRWLEEGNDLT